MSSALLNTCGIGKTSASLFSVPIEDQKPVIEVGQVFNRDNLVWYPITIKQGSEVVQIEALFDRKSEYSKYPNEVQYGYINELEATVITIDGSDKSIVCVPYGIKTLQIPKSISEFRSILLNILTREVNCQESDLKEVTIQNKALYALQLRLEPKIISTTSSVTCPEGKRIVSKTTKTLSGSIVMAYATKYAIYLLADKSYIGKLEPHTETFFNSFSVHLRS